MKPGMENAKNLIGKKFYITLIKANPHCEGR
jgi:hypothetical protein